MYLNAYFFAYVYWVSIFKPISQDLILLQCWHSCDANTCLLNGGAICAIQKAKGMEIFRSRWIALWNTLSEMKEQILHGHLVQPDGCRQVFRLSSVGHSCWVCVTHSNSWNVVIVYPRNTEFGCFMSIHSMLLLLGKLVDVLARRM